MSEKCMQMQLSYHNPETTVVSNCFPHIIQSHLFNLLEFFDSLSFYEFLFAKWQKKEPGIKDVLMRNFQLEGVESNFRDLEESQDKVARHFQKIDGVFEQQQQQ